MLALALVLAQEAEGAPLPSGEELGWVGCRVAGMGEGRA